MDRGNYSAYVQDEGAKNNDSVEKFPEQANFRFCQVSEAFLDFKFNFLVFPGFSDS